MESMRRLRCILRSFPFLYNRWVKYIFILFGVILVGLVSKSKLVCSNVRAQQLLSNICSKYRDGKSVGNLCQELCGSEEASLTCNVGKDTIFTGTVMHTCAVIKFSKPSLELTATKYYNYKNHKHISSIGDHFSDRIQYYIKSKFNINLDIIDAQRISYLKYKPKILNRLTEIDDISTLLVDNEYLALTLYEKFNLFPKLLGSCGSLYAVQKLNTISGFWHLMTLYDSQEEWQKRIRISLMILDYLFKLENEVTDPIVLCHISLSNFGVTDDFKKVMYINLDSVHPLSVVNNITSNEKVCKQHSECDYLDCRSFCNLITEKCQYGVVNNNLQIVCEKIFLGWMMSGRMLIPGLLLGPYSPRFLVELLEQCANPFGEAGTPRAPASFLF